MRYSVRKYIEEKVESSKLMNSKLSSVNNYVFNGMYIPLTPKMMNRLIGTNTVVGVHITTSNLIRDIKKMSGSKKTLSISTKYRSEFGDKAVQVFSYNAYQNIARNFTDAERESLSLGNSVLDEKDSILPCVLIIEGSRVASFDWDVYTALDKHGRRWVNIPNLARDLDMRVHMEIEKSIENLRLRLLKKHKPDIATWARIQYIDDKKLKATIIKDYMSELEKLLKKYKTKLFPSSNGQLGETDEYDEVLVNKFTIKKIYIGLTRQSREIYGSPSDATFKRIENELGKIAPVENVLYNWRKVNKHLK